MREFDRHMDASVVRLIHNNAICTQEDRFCLPDSFCEKQQFVVLLIARPGRSATERLHVQKKAPVWSLSGP